MLKFGFSVCFTTFALMQLIRGDCVLQIPSINQPLYTQKFGSKTIVMPFGMADLYLSEGEVLQGYCSTYFTLASTNYRFSSISSMNIKCLNEDYQVNPSEYDEWVSIGKYSPDCISNTWTLYELNHNLKNCKKMSYAVGTETGAKPVVLAAICYSLDNLSLKYINYISHQRTSVLEHQQVNN